MFFLEVIFLIITISIIVWVIYLTFGSTPKRGHYVTGASYLHELNDKSWSNGKVYIFVIDDVLYLYNGFEKIMIDEINNLCTPYIDKDFIYYMNNKNEFVKKRIDLKKTVQTRISRNLLVKGFYNDDVFLYDNGSFCISNIEDIENRIINFQHLLKKGKSIYVDKLGLTYYKYNFKNYIITGIINNDKFEKVIVVNINNNKVVFNSEDSDILYSNADKLVIYDNLTHIIGIIDDNKQLFRVLNKYTLKADSVFISNDKLYVLGHAYNDLKVKNEITFKEDTMFEINLTKDEITKLYTSRKNKGRIIGIEKDFVYIFNNGKVIRVDLLNNDRVLLKRIKEKVCYDFEMCKDYILAFNKEEVIFIKTRLY